MSSYIVLLEHKKNMKWVRKPNSTYYISKSLHHTIALHCSEWRLMLSPPGALPTTTDRGTEIFSTSVIFAVVLPPKVTEIRLRIDIICTTIRTRMKSMMLLGQRFDEKWWWWKNVTLSHQWYTYSRKGYRPPLKTNRKTVAFIFLFLDF